ncbi:MAG: hypothetical protein ACK52I_02790 [Pseudomonadota bacterium]|jgi:hypothetical protein
MKQKFAIGQKVTPNTRQWEVIFGEMSSGDFPEFGKVYTVARYPLLHLPGAVGGMMALEEKSPNKLYHQDKFDPLIEDSVLESELEAIGDMTLPREHLCDG